MHHFVKINLWHAPEQRAPLATFAVPFTPKPSSLTQVLICGAAIVTLSMGIRHGFGLWLQPITQARAGRARPSRSPSPSRTWSWGLAGIFAGMVADRLAPSAC
jgi:hypothetical protein